MVIESVSGILLAQMDVPIRVWHIVEIMRRDFSEHHHMQFSITQNQFGGTIEIMSKTTEEAGLDYTEVPDSRYVAQTVNDFCGEPNNNLRGRGVL